MRPISLVVLSMKICGYVSSIVDAGGVSVTDGLSVPVEDASQFGISCLGCVNVNGVSFLS